MIFADLKVSLKDKIAPAYVMSGSDIFLINKAVELVLSAAGIDKLNVVSMEEGVNADEINAVLSNVSMFGNTVAVLIRGTDETLLYLRPFNKPANTIKIDCNPMSESLVIRMIMQNKQFSLASATTLARMCENNFAQVSNGIEKLLAYYDGKETIQPSDIEQIVTKTEKYQIYELSGALLKKDALRADTILKSLSLDGIDDYAIFGNLVAFIRRLFYCKTSLLPDTELAKFLNCNPYAVTATRRDARAITPILASEIYEQALELEYQIKSGKIPTNRAIILLAGALL